MNVLNLVFIALSTFSLVTHGKSEVCDFDCLGAKEEAEVNLKIGRQSKSLSLVALNNQVKFFLYTRENISTPEEWTVFNGFKKAMFQGFKPNHKTKILIHGWLAYVPSIFTDIFRDAYLLEDDYNLIMVDWSEAGSLELYPWAKSQVPIVAREVAHFMDQLNLRYNIHPEDLHVLGHSLGAHIAGVAGRLINSGKIGRISGLDPAGPLYSPQVPEERLGKDSAHFVDVIHTCGLLLGTERKIGHIDFYPNGGIPIQPGCGIDWTGSCSHRRSYAYFAESITNPEGFMATNCTGWINLILGFCANHSQLPLGEHLPYGSEGTYYLKTNSKHPFARG